MLNFIEKYAYIIIFIIIIIKQRQFMRLCKKYTKNAFLVQRAYPVRFNIYFEKKVD